MGYEPTLLRCLFDAMRCADAGLDAIRSTDPDAASAIASVRSVQQLLNGRWIPVLDSLLRCRAMDGYTRTTEGFDDLIDSWLASKPGWSIWADPLATTVDQLSIEQARALGLALSRRDASEPLTNPEVAWLAETLAEVSATPALSLALLTGLSRSGWAEVCDRLGDQRIALVGERTITARLSEADRGHLDAIDSLFASLAAILANQLVLRPERSAITLTEQMHPYSAALLVSHLRLSAADLAAVSRDLIARYRQGGWADVQNAGPGTADILMQAMLATPGAPARFVLLTRDEPALMLDAAHSSQLAERLILVATDPANISVQEAGSVVPGLIHFIDQSYTAGSFYGQYDSGIGAFMVDLIAPWLLQFTVLHQRDWNLDRPQGAQLLAVVIDRDGGLDRLMAHRDRVAAGMTRQVAARTDAARHVIDDLAALLGLLDTVARAVQISDAEDVRAAWDIVWLLTGAATSLLPGNALIGVAVGGASTALQRLATNTDFGSGAVGAVRHDSLFYLDLHAAFAVAAVICARFDQMVADREVPDDTAPPPLPDPASSHPGAQYSSDFSEWLDAVHLGTGEDILNGIKQTMLSVHEGERNAVELALGSG